MAAGKPRRELPPKANPPICWLCDERLWSGGRSYVLIKGEDGHTHPAHHRCASELIVAELFGGGVHR